MIPKLPKRNMAAINPPQNPWAETSFIYSDFVSIRTESSLGVCSPSAFFIKLLKFKIMDDIIWPAPVVVHTAIRGAIQLPFSMRGYMQSAPIPARAKITPINMFNESSRLACICFPSSEMFSKTGTC